MSSIRALSDELDVAAEKRSPQGLPLSSLVILLLSAIPLAMMPFDSAIGGELARYCETKTDPLPFEGDLKHAEAGFLFSSDADEESRGYFCFERIIVNKSFKLLRVNWYDNWGAIMRGTILPKKEASTGVKGGVPIETPSTLKYGMWADEAETSTKVWRSNVEAPIATSSAPSVTWLKMVAELGGKPWDINIVLRSQVSGENILYEIESTSTFPMIYAQAGAPADLAENKVLMDWKAISDTKEYLSAARNRKYTLDKGFPLGMTRLAPKGVRLKSAPLVLMYPGSKDYIEVQSIAYVPVQ